MSPKPKSTVDTSKSHVGTPAVSARPVVPKIPSELSSRAAEIAKTLGQYFEREVNKAFLHAVTRAWAPDFWARFKDDRIEPGDDEPKQADDAGVSRSKMNKINNEETGGELSLGLLLGTLLNSGMSWGDVPSPPTRLAVSFRCYRQAIEYAQKQYCRTRADAQLPAKLTRVEFEYLLELHKHTNWFGLPIAEKSPIEELRAQVKPTRKAIAKKVDENAVIRLSAINDSDIQAYVNSKPRKFATPDALMNLEVLWGIAWMSAIHAIKFKWEV